MSDPVNLAAERNARREDYDGMACQCGETWFHIVGMIDKEGHVTTYQWPTCVACGRRRKQ